MSLQPPFSIDSGLSGDEYLAVNVAPFGTVIIKAEEDGIVVDIYATACAHGPVATACAHEAELVVPDEGGQP